MDKKKTSGSEPVVIKKYANRRLYNTDTSSYVTLEYLCQMVKEDRDFVVRDAKTGEDITRSVLTQIIFEEESKGQTMLPVNFLRQLISFYGDGLQNVVPGYLETAMATFAKNQEQYRKYFEDQFGAVSAFTPSQDFMTQFQEMARQNMKAFEQATQVFSGFAPKTPADTGDNGENRPGQKQSSSPQSGQQTGQQSDQQAAALELLQRQLAAMQAQIDTLSGKK